MWLEDKFGMIVQSWPWFPRVCPSWQHSSTVVRRISSKLEKRTGQNKEQSVIDSNAASNLHRRTCFSPFPRTTPWRENRIISHSVIPIETVCPSKHRLKCFGIIGGPTAAVEGVCVCECKCVYVCERVFVLPRDAAHPKCSLEVRGRGQGRGLVPHLDTSDNRINLFCSHARVVMDDNYLKTW